MALYKDITEKPFFIVGPCVMENQELLYTVAEKVAEIGAKYPVSVVFKSSFDKANRTSIHAYRGPGIEKGLEMLNNVKERFNLPVTTDIHEPFQAKIAAEVVDILQIPAFLCRQTDLLVAAAQTGKIVNVKKAQFLSGQDMFYPAQKVKEAGNEQIILTERGNSFGYNNLVVDFRNVYDMKEFGWIAPTRYSAPAVQAAKQAATVNLCRIWHMPPKLLA
jgi:2-dehydro-3-deoxyphosphooctonate aldolase (KDO 8-P synthase)